MNWAGHTRPPEPVSFPATSSAAVPLLLYSCMDIFPNSSVYFCSFELRCFCHSFLEPFLIHSLICLFPSASCHFPLSTKLYFLPINGRAKMLIVDPRTLHKDFCKISLGLNADWTYWSVYKKKKFVYLLLNNRTK